MGKDTVTTGIEGLDELLCGGLPKGSTVLLSGPPGAGKTVLALQYAFYHASRGERVLFVSTCEPLYKVNRYASSLSFYNLDLISGGINMEFYDPKIKRGYVELQDYSLGQMVDEQYVGDFFDGIQKKVTRRSIDHLIVDSITSINMLIGNEIDRRKKTLLFSAWVSRMGCTTLLTAEQSEGDGTERFLTDAIIDLGSTEISPLWSTDTLQNTRGRTIGVTKLRGKSHLSGRYLYNITRDGIRILPPGRITISRKGATTGIPDLDALTGGFSTGERWHFNTDGREPFGSMLRQMIDAALKAGEGVVLFAPSLGITDEVTLEEQLGPEAKEAQKAGRLIIVLKGPVAGKALGSIVSFATEQAGGLGKLAPEITSLTAGKRHGWIAFFDLEGLGEEWDTTHARNVFAGLVDALAAAGMTVITSADIGYGAGLSPTIEQHTDVVVDTWKMDLYWLLRVRKAPGAVSYEPHAVRVDEGKISLMKL
ncbi:RAD55 family ATPase [Methanocella arvoryzae]|nr:ATPase domain-containing protein [Methanocella arvoryzae]